MSPTFELILIQLAETKHVSSTSCGAPVRHSHKKFIVLGVAGAVMAVLAFVLRLCASMGKRGRTLSWDDLTMGIVVGLAIPPTIFIYNRKFPNLNGMDLGR